MLCWLAGWFQHKWIELNNIFHIFIGSSFRFECTIFKTAKNVAECIEAYLMHAQYTRHNSAFGIFVI